MTNAEKMMLITNAAAGLMQGASASRQAGVQNQQNAQSQQNFLLQQYLAALQNQQQTGSQLYDRQQQGAQNQAAMSPLGQEQAFVQKQRLMQALIPAIAGFQPAGPTDPAVAAAFKPPTNFLSQLNTPGMQQSFSDQATASSLADRRQMMAQVNPNYNFSSLDNFGLGTGFDQQIQQASADARTRQDEFSQRQEGLAQQGTSAVTDRMSQVTTGQPEKKKGGGVWGKIGSIAKVAVPIVLAATGVGIPAAMAITAGTNIAASKMQGKDWGDAFQSGVVGAATGAVGAGALGSAARGGMSAATQKALAQGVLSGADAKMQGGSWNDALGAGMTGAATSKLGDMAKAKFQGGSDGLNNQMGPQSLPLGSGYTDANNPGTGLFNTLKNSPQLQLASRALPSGQVPQGIEDNNASQINQMMKVVGGPKASLPKGSQVPTGQSPQGYPLANAPAYQKPPLSQFISALPQGQNRQFQVNLPPQVQKMQGPPAALGRPANPTDDWNEPSVIDQWIYDVIMGNSKIPSPFVGPALQPYVNRAYNANLNTSYSGGR